MESSSVVKDFSVLVDCEPSGPSQRSLLHVHVHKARTAPVPGRHP